MLLSKAGVVPQTVCPVTLFKGIHKDIKDMAENISKLKRKHMNSQSEALTKEDFFQTESIYRKISAKSGMRMLKAFFFTMVNRPENLAE